MAISNKLQKVLDQPVWEWCRFNPYSTSDTSVWTTAEDGSIPYIYQMNAQNFWRYSTESDSWQLLATCPGAASVTCTMRYSTYEGNYGKIISQPAADKIKIGFTAAGNNIIGKKFEVISGNGQGQTAIVTAASDEFVEDFGTATTGNSSYFRDSTKKWKVNQWVGYTCRVNFGALAGQQRKIIFNNETDIYFADTGMQAYDSWNNTGFTASPTASGTTTTHFVILSQELTLDTPLTTSVDNYSRYKLYTGGIWYMTGYTSTYWYTFYYDVLMDNWQYKSTHPGLIPSALVTDFTMERTGKFAGYFDSGTVSSANAISITDTTKTWTEDRYRNYAIVITDGTGKGQERRINSITGTYLEIGKPWDIIPDNTSQYAIYQNSNNIYFTGNAKSALYKYHVEQDNWSLGNIFDNGIQGTMIARNAGNESIGIASGTRNTTSITSISTTPVAGGTGYKLNDTLAISGGSNGKAYVESIDANGTVLSVSLRRCGSGYSTGTKATTGGSGTGCTINVATIGTTVYVTLSTATYFKVGDSVTIYGCSDALYNGTKTILGVDSWNIIEFETTAAANMAAAINSSTTVMVDAQANWTVNEHVGKLLCTIGIGWNGTAAWMRIISNTATSLTLQAATSGTGNGNRYYIQNISALGRAMQYKREDQRPFGYANSGSTTQLVDTSKNWIPGCWNNYTIRIVGGTGRGSEFTITSNTENTLTYAAQTFTPDTTTRYEIMDCYGTCTVAGTTTTLTDSTKNWAVNQWAGKQVRYIGGSAGISNEYTIASNTANTLTFSAAGVAPAIGTTYVIYGCMPKGAGMELVWTFKGGFDRQLLTFRGGATNTIDIYDIPTERWRYTAPMYPGVYQTFTTGSQYAYDADNDYVYVMPDNSSRLYRLDLKTLNLIPAGNNPYGHSTARLGNRMEIVETADGLKFLYLARHNGQEVWRVMLWY